MIREIVTLALGMTWGGFLRIFWFSAFGIAVNVKGDLPEYCGKEGNAYTPLRKRGGEQYALKQVHVVIRLEIQKVKLCAEIISTISGRLCFRCFLVESFVICLDAAQ